VHLVNLALGSSKKVLRSREPNFILESSRFNEVLVERQHRTQQCHCWRVRCMLTRVSVSKCLGLGTGRTHRTRQGASSLLPREVCNLSSRRMLSGWNTGPWLLHPVLGGLQVQLAVNRAPDTLQSASGATLSAFGGEIFAIWPFSKLFLRKDPWQNNFQK